MGIPIPPHHFAKLLGLEDVPDESFGNGVEDELVLALDDNPGTTAGTTFSVLHKIFCPFWSDVALEPTHWYNRALGRVFLMTRRLVCPGRIDVDCRILVLPHLVALLHWHLLPLWVFSLLSLGIPFT